MYGSHGRQQMVVMILRSLLSRDDLICEETGVFKKVDRFPDYPQYGILLSNNLADVL